MKNYNATENLKEAERYNPAPAFQFYPKDFISDPTLAALNLEEFGLFMRLICFLWLEENFEFSEKKLAKILHITPKKFQKLFAPMKNIFEISNGIICYPKLEAERQKQANWRAKSSLGGQKSAELRRKGGSNLVATVVEPTNQPNGNIASSSAFASSSSEEEEPLPAKRRALNFPETVKSEVGLNARAREASRTNENPAVSEVFEYWRSEYGSTKPLTDHYRKMLETRLSEGFTVEVLKRAAAGFALSGDELPQNVKGQSNFSMIFKGKDAVERYAGFVPAN